MQLDAASWAWIPITLAAALGQTFRNAAQRTLTATAGTLAATLVRFLYGLPVALAWLALVRWGWGGALSQGAAPAFGWGYAGWLVVAALAQLAATALLLLAMASRNFIVAVTWSKTEVLQVALFSAVFLQELPGPVLLAGMVAATVGVVLLSPAASGSGGPGGRAVVYGLASGACFAMASIGYRGASLQLQGVSPWLAGAWNVAWAQGLQTLLLGGWLAMRAPASLGVVLRSWRLSSAAGSAGAFASICWLTATAMRPATEVRTLGLVEVIFSYLVSQRLFAESLSMREKLGMGLVGVGLVVACARL
ncbi:EamA/RhaT family transporter [Xylophilus sp. GOD-11R]|uniref:EamA/RhaT family transporter n=1 Tax=Xylophilus sp. GOD-11R TaxID=3089814 RepID=UPI00298D01BC|nr:EamA/RhaT family transporter [Xylophilus sp. GOD-11R]WPB58060.1 EamA/RhaT family transporter [Xylophilus sp. GOD-11R]